MRRFDSTFDSVTQQHMAWDGYWCPHAAEFLNWRYLADPVREHAGLALTVGPRLTGYSVVRVDGGRAVLMEFVAPREAPDAARTLLRHVIKVATEADCSHLVAAAPPAWQHGRLLRSAGFVALPSDFVMYAFSEREDTPGLHALENRQFLGGDLDPFWTSGSLADA